MVRRVGTGRGGVNAVTRGRHRRVQSTNDDPANGSPSIVTPAPVRHDRDERPDRRPPKPGAQTVPDIPTLAEILFSIAALAVPLTLLSALLRGDGFESFANIWKAPDFNAWPRGVQEEEPFRWGTTATS
jgi:hypothetical protein